jgi:hypothetical protein
MESSTAQQSIRQAATSQRSTIPATNGSQNFGVSASKRPEYSNSEKMEAGARSVGFDQVDSICKNDQFSKMTISPKVEKLPIPVRKSSEFAK